MELTLLIVGVSSAVEREHTPEEKEREERVTLARPPKRGRFLASSLSSARRMAASKRQTGPWKALLHLLSPPCFFRKTPSSLRLPPYTDSRWRLLQR